MTRTGAQNCESILDGREVHINGERVKYALSGPMFEALLGMRARICHMARDCLNLRNSFPSYAETFSKRMTREQ